MTRIPLTDAEVALLRWGFADSRTLEAQGREASRWSALFGAELEKI